MNETDYISIPEAIEITGKKEPTIRRLIQLKKIEYKKVPGERGREVRIEFKSLKKIYPDIINKEQIDINNNINKPEDNINNTIDNNINNPISNEKSEISEVERELIDSLKEELEFTKKQVDTKDEQIKIKDEQIKRKDEQIDNAQELVLNTQKLLGREQEKNKKLEDINQLALVGELEVEKNGEHGFILKNEKSEPKKRRWYFLWLIKS